MPEINLLIIEDEDVQIQNYKDVIDQYNKKSEVKIKYNVFTNFPDGEQALRTSYYDAAIIDLKLSSNDELEGKRLVETIYQKLRIPIVIYSGSISQIDDVEENVLLKKRLRTQQLSKILDEIVTIYKTGITSLLKPGGIVDERLTHIFWNHLSRDLDIWIKNNNSDTLLRYILAHFQEYLDIDPSGDFHEYHPSEVYIRPKIKQNLHTGDMIEHEGAMYIILTPACDIVINYKSDDKGNKTPFRKAESILLASVIDFDFKKLCLNKKSEVDKGKLAEFVRNGNYRFHYLPPHLNKNGYLIDFQSLISISFDKDIKPVASISAPFIKDIISRFANYYSRQGQPTFHQNDIIEQLFITRYDK